MLVAGPGFRLRLAAGVDPRPEALHLLVVPGSVARHRALGDPLIDPRGVLLHVLVGGEIERPGHLLDVLGAKERSDVSLETRQPDAVSPLERSWSTLPRISRSIRPARWIRWGVSGALSVAANRDVDRLRRLLDERHLATAARSGSPGSRSHEVPEEGLGSGGAGVELGGELRGEEEGMVGELDDLDEPLVGRGAARDETLVLQPTAEDVVHLVAVAVALVDDRLAEDLARPGAVVDLHRVGAEPHGPAHVGDLLLLR